LKALVTNQLLAYGDRRKSSVTQKLVLPNILPEDLDGPRTNRRHPLRLETKKPEAAMLT
jgi:nitrate/nitrite transport system ATP-binding protein